MDLELLVIFGFILVLSSMAFSMAQKIHRRVVDHEERKLELLARTEEAKQGSGATSEAYRKLEERVRVLERIATDGRDDLARQIEELRDLQELDAIGSTREAAR
ncbi:hypothetical protein [Altererythrobacter sp.]|uniref:hypothetical protein n=1 Tax=Altererythrobacter sp. TaxID=1872480 RepID=UPI003D01A0BF